MQIKAKWFIALIMVTCVSLILSCQRDQFAIISSSYIVFFLGYLFILQQEKHKHQIGFWLAVAIFLRVIAVFFFPNLSDDIFRFIWDGNLLSQGINPFEALPSYYVDPANLEKLSSSNIEIDKQLYDKLNSPNYFSIYPPLSQLSFWVSSLLFGSSWYGQAVFLKLLLLLSEIGSLILLRKILQHYYLPASLVLIYALNPLVIIEICGNIHFEGMMILFFLWAYWSIIKKDYVTAGFLYALSFLTKLVTALPSLFLLKKISTKALIVIIISGLITSIAGFIPLVNASFTSNFTDSLNLYFQKFEFNASIYYLAKWVGYQYKGFNMINLMGPLIAFIGVLIIVIGFFIDQKKNLFSFPQMVLYTLTVYFLFGTTVHPWYITTLIAFSCFTKYRFPILWSFLIFMTYVNYSYDPYFENLWVVALEYSVLIVFIVYELINKKSLR